MLKLAGSAKGYERADVTASCLLLAENLRAAGDEKGARRIHGWLREHGEGYVREAVGKGVK